MKNLLNLLNEEKYYEALEGFQKIYDSTKNPIALYYITFIQYYYTNDYDINELYDNFKTLYNYSKEVRINSYDFYLSFLIDNNDYDLALSVAIKSLKETKQSFVNCYAYSKSLSKLNKDLDKAQEYAQKCPKFEDLNETQKVLSYMNLAEIYGKNNEFDLAKEIINKLYLTSTNTPLISLLELQLSIQQKNNEEISKLADDCLKYEQNKFEALRMLCEYYYDSEQFELSIKYHEMIKPLLEEKSFANERMVICYLYLDKYEEGINLLKEEPLDDVSHTNYLLGELYYYKGGKANYKEAVHYYKKALETTNDKEKLLKALGDAYFELIDTENILKTSNELRNYSKHGYADYLHASYYRLMQQFDKAEKLIKDMKKSNIPNFRLNTIIDNCASNPEILNKEHTSVFDKNDKYSIRDRIKILIFGEYGNSISMDEAKRHVNELEQIKDLHTCAYSTIATYYLFTNEEEKAYKYAKQGYDKYLNNEEPCQCCAAIVAYMKLKGLGTSKNIEEAFEICKSIEEKELGDVNENAGHVYAECSLLLNKDLEHTYNLLEKTTFRRYSPSRYFMLIKIGKFLNKDISKYQKLFKDSLEHCSQREKEYYSKDQKEFLINNY